MVIAYSASPQPEQDELKACPLASIGLTILEPVVTMTISMRSRLKYLE
jgi:hypothetical protein